MLTGFEVTDRPELSVATAVKAQLPTGALVQVMAYGLMLEAPRN